MNFLSKFYDNVQRDFRLFIFILILLEVYRMLFIWLMSDYISTSTESFQIFKALFVGLRLSLKTAGAITLASFIFVTLLQKTPRLRLTIGIFASLIFSLLFMLRFPYYKVFGSTFGLEIVYGLDEEFSTIMIMLIMQYGIIWRALVAFLFTTICIAIYSRLLLLKTISLPKFKTSNSVIYFIVVFFLGISSFAVFVRFGGSFSYENGINWENSGVTTDYFLNECILDDAQALYRAHSMAKRNELGKISNVSPDKILECATFVSPHNDIIDGTLKSCLEREATGEKIKTPKHIFIILGETFMQWPLLGKYDDLFISNGLRSLIADDNCYYSRNFLPNGTFTSSAVNGIVTGLPDININLNYQKCTFEKPFITAMASAFKELGYNVDFWYGGIPSWDSIARVVIAQGFDHFYAYPDLKAPKQNIWGAKDEDLFDALFSHLKAEPPTIHIVLTTTNHPPYNLDLKKEGFDLEAEIKALKSFPNILDINELAVELGHYWYMDKVITDFVRKTSENYPESLFVITGDHAIRVDPSTIPTIFEHQSVPFVLYGKGITKNILPPDVVGGHTSIIPTIIELIAPQGFVYYSITPSLFESNSVAFNNEIFLTSKVAGKIDSNVIEFLPHISSKTIKNVNLAGERDLAQKTIEATRTVTWWLITKGLSLNEQIVK